MATKSAHEFGRYLRGCRSEAKISLRSAAKNLGVSAVYLGEVERGVRPPFKESRWEDIAKAIPNVYLDTLRRLSANTKPIQLDLRDSPPQYQNLALALARRVEKQNLSIGEIDKLFSILGGTDD